MSRVKDRWKFTLRDLSKDDDEQSLAAFSYSYLTGKHRVSIYSTKDSERPCELELDSEDIKTLINIVRSMEEVKEKLSGLQ